MSALPPLCYARHPETGRTILIVHGETGYYPAETELPPEELNSVLGRVPTTLQAEAMLTGCMFGWDIPGANPDVSRERHRGLS